MAEDDENIPMWSHSWLWKKKRNSIFPAVESKSESKTGAWIQMDFPSSSQAPEKGFTNNVDSKSQSNIISCISLPGSVTDDIVQAHSSKNIVMDEEIGHGYPSCPGQLFHDIQMDGYQSKEELFYIPYRLAKVYITKIVKDMHQMKARYVKVIKELEHVGEKSQEQAIMAVKNQYSDKIKHLRASLEAYQEMVGKEKLCWQDTRKKLEEENRRLREEKEDLMNLIQVQDVNADKEKVDQNQSWLLKSIMQKLHCLYTEHNLTIKELRRSRLDLEKVQKMVDIEEAQDYLSEKKLLLAIKANLEQVKSSLQKRETELKDLLQTEHCCSPQLPET